MAEKNVIIYADAQAYAALVGNYPFLEHATADSFGTEFMDYKLAIKTVASLEEALAHIDENGCEQVDTLHLSFIDTAIHIINHTARFCDEGSAVLEVVTSLENYLWSTGETTQAITVFDEGTYSVTATQGECSVQAQITINPCEREIILPNAFSPDGDGINDDFGIPETLLNQINDYGFQITVINRWGNVVFTSSDKHFRWNGEVNGKVYRDNIYNYVIDYKTRSGSPRHLTGSVITL